MESFAGYRLDDLQLSSKVERRLSSLLDTTTSRSMARPSTKSWKSGRRSKPGSDYKPMQLKDLIPTDRFTTHEIFCIFVTPLSATQVDRLHKLREQDVVPTLDINDNQSGNSREDKDPLEDNSGSIETGKLQNPSAPATNTQAQELKILNNHKVSSNSVLSDNSKETTNNTTTSQTADSTTRSTPSDHSHDEVGLNARILDQATSDQIQEILLVVDDDTTLVELIESTTNREFIKAAIKQIADPQLLEQLTHISSSEIFYCLRSRYRQLTGVIA